MNKIILFFALIISIGTMGQKGSIRLNFTAVNNTQQVVLDSIRIWNTTAECDSTLQGSDTSISVGVLGIDDNLYPFIRDFRISQCYPNPFIDRTKIKLTLPESGQVEISITDLSGKQVACLERQFSPGLHIFSFFSGNPGFYVLSARCGGWIQSVRMISTGNNGTNKIRLSYDQSESWMPKLKSSAGAEEFVYNNGDQLVFIGYSNGLQSGIAAKPLQNTTYTFQFASNIPCPDAPVLEYEGKSYSTIQILSQCWMKENLNVGVMVNGADTLKDNGIVEKYCYGDSEANCAVYGGLYQKDELMQYSTDEGSRGICPEGWHIPSKADWSILMGATNSYSNIEDPIWWGFDCAFLGEDIGKNLKSTTGWQGMNGIDKFGFNILPAGERDLDGGFLNLHYVTHFVSSTHYIDPVTSHWDHGFYYNSDSIWQGTEGPDAGLSCRCIKDQ
jgi:uncharacterized protein (TIGR02145 family)